MPALPPRLRRYGLIGLGWLCLVLAVVGALLPVMQGWMFLAAGLAILSREQPWALRLVLALRRRFPGFAGRLDRHAVRARRWWRRRLRRKAPFGPLA
ncbi:MAG TPA: PGPGW domain-containing protein [Alphaproteobacteria bacterium]|nr:PGPGW domain-containing protein [Alphaproteobacteria bacterium]